MGTVTQHHDYYYGYHDYPYNLHDPQAPISCKKINAMISLEYSWGHSFTTMILLHRTMIMPFITHDLLGKCHAQQHHWHAISATLHAQKHPPQAHILVTSWVCHSNS